MHAMPRFNIWQLSARWATLRMGSRLRQQTTDDSLTNITVCAEARSYAMSSQAVRKGPLVLGHAKYLVERYAGTLHHESLTDRPT